MSSRDNTKLNTILTDRHSDYTVNEDGDVIVERQRLRKEQSSDDLVRTTVKVNLTKRYQTARRTTSNVSILVIEAELYHEKGEVENPATPSSEGVERQARERIRKMGLTPAWEAA